MVHVTDRRSYTFSPEQVTTEASDIGLGPGIWPEFIAIINEGGGFLVQRAYPVVHEEDVVAMVYLDRTRHLPPVHVVND